MSDDFGTSLWSVHPRHGFRRWHRWICRALGHRPWYSTRLMSWDGFLAAYVLSCWRCGKELDTFRRELLRT